jgi:NTP pyrophosphatase (non-canonical NTP hydrolase)
MPEAPVATYSNWKKLGLRCHRWWMAKMGITIGTQEERAFLIMGLTGELGELANFMKKEWRDGSSPELLIAIRKEIADVRGYLEHLGASYGLDVDYVTVDKTNELIARWPEAFEEPQHG